MIILARSASVLDGTLPTSSPFSFAPSSWLNFLSHPILESDLTPQWHTGTCSLLPILPSDTFQTYSYSLFFVCNCHVGAPDRNWTIPSVIQACAPPCPWFPLFADSHLMLTTLPSSPTCLIHGQPSIFVLVTFFALPPLSPLLALCISTTTLIFTCTLS